VRTQRERGERVADDRREDEDDAAHGGRAALRVVADGAVVPDELAPLEPVEQPDEQRCQEEREEQRDHRSGEE